MSKRSDYRSYQDQVRSAQREALGQLFGPGRPPTGINPEIRARVPPEVKHWVESTEGRLQNVVLSAFLTALDSKENAQAPIQVLDCSLDETKALLCGVCCEIRDKALDFSISDGQYSRRFTICEHCTDLLKSKFESS